MVWLPLELVNLWVPHTGALGGLKGWMQVSPSHLSILLCLQSELTATRGAVSYQLLQSISSLHLISLFGSDRRWVSLLIPQEGQMCSRLNTKCLFEEGLLAWVVWMVQHSCGCSHLHASSDLALHTECGAGQGDAHTSWLKPFQEARSLLICQGLSHGY